jgi:hypothetical protein
MSAASEVEDACARGAKPRPAGRVRARGRRATRQAHIYRAGTRSAVGSARRRAIAQEADARRFGMRYGPKEADA